MALTNRLSRRMPPGKPMGPSSTGPVPVAMNKTGVPNTIPNRNVATQPAPALTQGSADSRTAAFTYFTKVGGTNELYNGQRQWVRVTLVLETAGPVAVGPASKLTPIFGGAGTLLKTNEPKSFTIAKGTKLYITATTVSRVSVVIEPLPWLEQITGIVGSMFGKMLTTLGR